MCLRVRSLVERMTNHVGENCQRRHDRLMKSLPPIVATVAILLLALGAYMGAYFWMGRCIDIKFGSRDRLRRYPHQWQAIVFKPAGRVESACLGRNVVAVYLTIHEDGQGELVTP